MTGSIVILVLLFGPGVPFSMGKGASLIAGYNTLSKEKKEQYDQKALCKFMGKLMFAVAAILLLSLAGRLCPEYPWRKTGSYALIAVIPAAVVYMNTGKRFRKKA